MPNHGVQSRSPNRDSSVPQATRYRGEAPDAHQGRMSTPSSEVPAEGGGYGARPENDTCPKAPRRGAPSAARAINPHGFATDPPKIPKKSGIELIKEQVERARFPDISHGRHPTPAYCGVSDLAMKPSVLAWLEDHTSPTDKFIDSMKLICNLNIIIKIISRV